MSVNSTVNSTSNVSESEQDYWVSMLTHGHSKTDGIPPVKNVSDDGPKDMYDVYHNLRSNPEQDTFLQAPSGMFQTWATYILSRHGGKMDYASRYSIDFRYKICKILLHIQNIKFHLVSDSSKKYSYTDDKNFHLAKQVANNLSKKYSYYSLLTAMITQFLDNYQNVCLPGNIGFIMIDIFDSFLPRVDGYLTSDAIQVVSALEIMSLDEQYGKLQRLNDILYSTNVDDSYKNIPAKSYIENLEAHNTGTNYLRSLVNFALMYPTIFEKFYWDNSTCYWVNQVCLIFQRRKLFAMIETDGIFAQ
jgi:hypothetical protein